MHNDFSLPSFILSPPSNIHFCRTCGFFTRDAIYSFFARPDKLDYNDLTFPANRSYVLLGVNQVLRKKAVYSNIFMTAVAAAQQVCVSSSLEGRRSDTPAFHR